VKLIHSRLDFERIDRLGMFEAVWGEHKTSDQIIDILKNFILHDQVALVTRVSQDKAEKIIKEINLAKYHVEAKCLTIGNFLKQKKSLGEVYILSGGTSDLRVALESKLALDIHGIKNKIFSDIGVAGLHRLLNQLERIKKAKVLIACAGMEGALPTVLSGLISKPIIGVPTSVGYGISSKGKAALNGMLSSCAPGLMVVNIDNGYGAAMAALRIMYA